MPKIATDSFELDLPETWRIETLRSPAKVKGASGESLMVNFIAIASGAPGREMEAVKQELQQNAENAMEFAARDDRLRVTHALKKRLTKGGCLFAELHCRTTDGSTYFSQFSLAGPSTVVLVTLEGPAGSESAIPLIRNAVQNISWSQSKPITQQETPRKKPFWKFW